MAPRNRPHILIQRPAQAEPFKPPPRNITGKVHSIPMDRRRHGERLSYELVTVNQLGLDRRGQCAVPIQQRSEGICVTFESFPGLELVLESLDPVAKKKPELLSVQRLKIDGLQVDKATVYIPDGELAYFLDRLQQYVDTAATPKPKNYRLVDRIRSIALASLRELWTDPPDEFPQGDGAVWWEVWLRRRGGLELETLSTFVNAVEARIGQRSLGFTNRTVVLVEARPTQLTQALDVLDDIAELRRPRQTATMLASEPAAEQAEWVAELAARTTVVGGDAPAACIVDTGVHQPHPLLEPSLSNDDCHACDPTWGSGDHDGHGTEMAGLALYGDLGAALLEAGTIQLRHRLESVKLLPPPPQINSPENYGALTATVASLVEISAPHRRRVFSMAITAPSPSVPIAGAEEIIFGQPSSWSAAVDALSSGLSIDVTEENISFLDATDDARRLFLISAGNVSADQFDANHLDRSDLSPIEDPAQAWNALTVGAYTTLDTLADPAFNGWTPVAEQGELSPFSRTSVAFSRVWPVKPDVVIEGGNTAQSPEGGQIDTPDDLQIPTTNAPLTSTRLLTVSHGTSAATAQAAHLGASLLAEYPSLWPETVRALIIHSAEWTPAMEGHFYGVNQKSRRIMLQRRYGMGVPDLTRALRSGSDALTLVIQDVISPFDTEGKMREMHLHDLPWPSDILADLGAVEVRLRVTLSYFIEPNPGARGWVRRYSYASHGLRFDLRRPAESTDAFRKRVNAKALDEDERRPSSEADSDQWLFGAKGREKGSLHTDIWTGSAADLARRGAVAIFPVSGWWKFNKKAENDQRRARYALILSIETPEIPGQTIDIWTPVAQEVGIPVEIEA